MTWRRWIFRILLAGVLAIGMGYLPYRLYGPGGVTRALRLERTHDDLLQGNDKLRRENAALRQQIKALKEDRETIEQVARDEHGLVRAGDIVFQFQW